jgi:DNA-nicking Smr family endonuclease
MTTFTLKIDCDNAAFDDNEADEVARILRSIADKLEHGQTNFPNVFDIHGNTVGEARLKFK